MKGNRLLKRVGCVLLGLIMLSSVCGVAFAKEMQLFHDKLAAPSWQGPFERLAELAADQIGLSWETVGYANTDMHQTAVRTSLPTSRAPEMFTWWSDFRMEALYKSGGLADLTDIWDDRADEYNPALRAAFEFDGGVYGVPANLAYWSVWYSRPIFDRYNLEPPKTWAEFLELNEFLLSQGITPLGHTVNGRWPTFIWFEEILIRLDPDIYEALMVGEVKYDHPTVLEAFDIWQELIDKGYFVDPGTDVFADFPRMMANGQTAMVLMGDWYTDTLDSAGLKAGVDYDTFILPPINEEVGNVIIYEAAPIVFGKNASGAEDARKVADWWMSPEIQAEWAKIMGFIPANSKSASDFLIEPKKNLVRDIHEGDYRLVNRYWEATPTEICENAVDEFARFMLNPDQKDDVISVLNTIADRYWSAR
jgi:multiple sugar transport system substrate-binding protein